MKKMIAAAALLGLASAVFGQSAPTVTLGGGLWTGVAAQFNGKDHAQVGLWDDTDFKNIGRFKLTGKADMGGNGVAFDLRADGLSQDAKTLNSSNQVYNPIILKSVFAYANFLDKMVYTQVGIISENSVRSKGDMALSFTKEVPGAAIVVRPVDGLAVQGALVNIVDLKQSSGYSNQFYNLSDASAVVGASYTMAGTGTVLGQIQTGYNTNKAYGLSKAQFAANLVAVSNLNLWAEGYIFNLNDGKKHGINMFDETASYDLKDAGVPGVSVGLNSYWVTYGDDFSTNGGKDKLNLSYLLQPWVSATLDGGAVAKLGLTYLAGSEVVAGYISGVTGGVGEPLILANTKMEGSDSNKIATFDVYPSISAPVGKGSTVGLGVHYTASVGSDKVSFTSTQTGANSLTTVVASYNYTF